MTISAAERVARRERRRRRRTRLWRIGASLFGGLALAAAVVLAWLDARGVPRFLHRRVQKELSRLGVMVEFDHLRFSLRGGLRADRLRWRLRSGDLTPLVDAEELTIRLRAARLLRGEVSIAAVAVRGATVNLPLEADPRAWTLTKGRLDARPRPDGGWQIDRFEAQAGKLRLTAAGAIGPPAPRAKRPDEWRRQLEQTLGRAQPAFAHLRQQGLPEIRGSAEARIEFDLYPAEPARHQARVTVQGQDLRIQGLAIESGTLTARLDHRQLILDEAVLQAAGHRLAVRGAWNLETSRLRLAAEGRVPLAWLQALPLPPVAAERVARLRAFTPRPLAFDWETDGDLPPAEVARRWAAHIRAEDASILGVELAAADVDVARTPERLQIRRAVATLGRGPGAGPVSGEGFYDPDTGRYGGRIRAAADPAGLLPLVNPAQAEFIGGRRWLGPPPVLEGEFSGRLDHLEDLVIRGTVAATNLVWNGAGIASASARVGVTNEVLRLDDLDLRRGADRLTGWYEQDFKNKLARFEGTNSLPPAALARIIGPKAHRFLQRFRVEGPALVRGAGQVDYGGGTNNALRVRVEAERFGLRWFLADRARFDLEMAGREVRLDNIDALFYDGTLAGRATFHLAEPGGRAATTYAIEGRVRGADFGRLVCELTDCGESKYSGRLNARAKVAGAIGPGEGRSVTGGGRIEVRKGRLMEIPLLGGLSKYLSMLIPGLGFSSQNDFTADFVLKNGRASTEEARLEGSLLSVFARGDYQFDGRLRFAVQAKLLRKGLLAAALRLVTLPVTKLFEFDLRGTLDAPEWSPHNLPEL